jgi:KDO2-lipid IV(A) lauroyltransferase
MNLRRWLRGVANRAAAAPLRVMARVLPAVPTRAVLAFADALGDLLWLLDARGRSAGMQNLAAVMGDELSPRERRRVLRASYRNAIACEVLLFHVQPPTPERYRRFVAVDADDEARWREKLRATPSVVVASGHFGNWELLLQGRHALDFVPPLAYLAETTGIPSVDALLGRLRDRDAGGVAMRKSGALALKGALAEGKSVALLVDRNVRGYHGGEYVPFLGLPARTTPLAATLARWYRRPLLVMLAVPAGRAKWRLWLSDDLLGDITDDADADVAAANERINAILSRAIREHPGAWAWMIKRWKSRPAKDLGSYPAYSLYDREKR